jgi:hypothetical protein
MIFFEWIVVIMSILLIIFSVITIITWIQDGFFHEIHNLDNYEQKGAVWTVIALTLCLVLVLWLFAR